MGYPEGWRGFIDVDQEIEAARLQPMHRLTYSLSTLIGDEGCLKNLYRNRSNE